MSLKAKVEAIIYATEEPVTLNQLASLLKDATLAELRAEDASRLALNETVSTGPVANDEEDDETADLPVEDTLVIEREDQAGGTLSPKAGATDANPADAPPTDPTPASDAKTEKSEAIKRELQEIKARLSTILNELMADYASPDRGMEIRQIAGGYRIATKPEHHDVVVNFAKSLKPPVRLSLQALETLAVIAYKQPITVPEISEIRGVDSAGVIATLLDRKLITTAGRKQVIGRPILYKTTKEFLLRFGLKDVSELPSVEEFEKLGDPQAELFTPAEPAAANDSAPTAPREPVADDEAPVTEAAPELASSANAYEAAPTDVAAKAEAAEAGAAPGPQQATIAREPQS